MFFSFCSSHFFFNIYSHRDRSRGDKGGIFCFVGSIGLFFQSPIYNSGAFSPISIKKFTVDSAFAFRASNCFSLKEGLTLWVPS